MTATSDHNRPVSKDQPAWTRRKLGAAVLAAALCLGPLAALAQTQIYDARTKKWVNYDKKKARQYFARNNQLPEAFRRQVVPFRTAEQPGTIIIDGNQHFLYLVQPGGQAIRYGIGVGREGFAWSGRAIVAYKRKWPRWTPPDEMVARQPKLAPYSIANGGMPPRIKNPLGARALYIHKDGKDTLYRIHGSPEAHSIGKAVSSGCIRLLNQDVVYLYDQVRDGSTIVVIPDPAKGDLAVG